MGNTNEEFLLSVYDAFGRGDVPTVLRAIAEDIDWHVGGRNPVAGDYRGREEVLGFFGQLMALSGGTFRLEVLDVLANEDHGTVLTRETAEYAGKSMDNYAVHVWDLADGVCTRFRGYNQETWDDFWNQAVPTGNHSGD